MGFITNLKKEKNMNYKAKIFVSDYGTVQNQLTKFLEDVDSVVCMTQSSPTIQGLICITIIYTEKVVDNH